MVHYKVFLVSLLAAAATSEPPVSGYKYQQPVSRNSYQAPTNSYQAPTNSYQAPTNSYQAPTNSYLPPISGFTSPSNNYLTPTFEAAQHHDGSDHHHSHDNQVPKSYEFGYSVKDAQSGNDYDRKESSDGHEVRGEYRVQLPDGRTQIVTYHADWKTGFHADVRYEGQATYPTPTHNHRQGGYNYKTPTPDGFSGSLTGFHGNRGYKQPSTAYGPPGYH